MAAVDSLLFILAGGVLWKWGAMAQLESLAFDTTIAKLQFMQFLAVKLGLLQMCFPSDSACSSWPSGTLWSRLAQSCSAHHDRALDRFALADGGAGNLADHCTPHYPAFTGGIRTRHWATGKLLNTNSAIYVLVVIWWIVCLWIDEPARQHTATLRARTRLI